MDRRKRIIHGNYYRENKSRANKKDGRMNTVHMTYDCNNYTVNY